MEGDTIKGHWLRGRYPDKLYQLAFALRKAKLWRSLYENELFAVTLSGGEIGYCCVMGSVEEHLALALYRGSKGLDSLRFLSRRVTICS